MYSSSEMSLPLNRGFGRRGEFDFSDQSKLETPSFFRKNVIEDNIVLQTTNIFGLFDINCSLNFSHLAFYVFNVMDLFL